MVENGGYISNYLTPVKLEEVGKMSEGHFQLKPIIQLLICFSRGTA